MVLNIILVLLLSSCATKDAIIWGDKVEDPKGWVEYCKTHDDIECKK